MRVMKWVIGVPIGLFLLALLIGALAPESVSTDPEVAKWERASAACWKDVEGRKDFTPTDKAGVAKFCMGLDDRVKYAKAAKGIR